MEREQKLIDIMFSVAMVLHENKKLQEGSREDLADWISYQLKECGFKTHPQGMSWAVLEREGIDIFDAFYTEKERAHFKLRLEKLVSGRL